MNIERVSVPETATLREVIAQVDAGGLQLALVVKADSSLVGIVTDGDIRRGLLRGLTLDTPALQCANVQPTTIRAGASQAEMLALMKRRHLHQLIVVDDHRKVVDVVHLDNLLNAPSRPNEVVLMVGGLGSRLGDLTRVTPKPMLPVGGRPLLEIILDSFMVQGFSRFWFAVNYRANVIEEHFGDGSKLGCRIDYLREPMRLGTAGALSLLPHTPTHPIIVSNGDLLHRLDFGDLLAQHERSGAEATMAVRKFDYQVPYGVVTARDGRLISMEEKPVQTFMISGGLYALSPAALRHVPTNRFFDMPALFSEVVHKGGEAGVFEIDGYWLDIGHQADYEQAQREFSMAFPGA